MQYKTKVLLFLALLLMAVTQGAWAASGIYCTASDQGRVVCTDGTIYDNVSAATAAGKTAVAKIIWVDESTKKGLALALTDEGTYTPSNAIASCNAKNTSQPVAGATWKLASQDEWNTMVTAAGGHVALRDGFNSVGGTNMEQWSYYSSTGDNGALQALSFDSNDGLGTWSWGYPSWGLKVRACLAFDLLTLYTIGSESEWNAFCTAVNGGDTFIDKYVKLTADISVSSMAGTSDANSFQGAFDGDSHKLTFTKGTSGSPFNEDYCAPFRHVKNATIKNLHVAGIIYTSAMNAAGFVGESHGALIITNSRSSVAITGSKSGDGTHAGLVSILSGEGNTILIDGCVFDGSFATTVGTTNCGGFVGWPVYNKPTIKNSLMIPASVSAGMLGNTFARWHTGYEPTIEGCYYVAVSNLPTNQGAEVTAYTDVPLNLGSQVRDYGLVTVYKNGIQFDGKYYSAATTLSGTGTEDDPYIISTAGAWDEFAQTVNNGTNNFSGKYVRLALSISVSEMVGASETNSFQGTFLGNGQTLTFTKGSADAAFGEENCAPFRYTKNATIQNLKVAGDIYTSQKLAAGLVSRPYASTNITNCVVSTNIYSSVRNSNNNDGAHGGFVAMPNGGTLNITGCAYTGRLLTNSGTTNCGGFVGWYNSATITVTNSLYAPTGSIPEGWSAINAGTTFVRGGSPTLTNCYLTELMGDAQGRLVRAFTSAPDNLGNAVENGNYGFITAYENGLLFDGMYYAIPVLPGSGTQQAPYTISNTDEWNLFAALVNSGTNNYSGKYVKLTANITVSETVGQRDGYPFSGTFLGNGHTITADISSTTSGTGANEQGVAPFHYISGATIKNLEVAGTIASASFHTGGLVGFADGTNLIEGCAVTATLNVSSNYAGGIIGHGRESATTIRGCAFAGAINGVDGNRENIGGIWGWSTSSPVLEDCLEAGTYTNIASMHPIGLQKASGTITGCYYVNAQVGSPTNACTVSGAKQADAYDALPEWMGAQIKDYGLVTAYANGIFFGGKYYKPADTFETLTDGDTYTRTEDYEVTAATYKKTTDRVGKRHAWLMPFDYTITADDADNFTFYKINMIANSPDPEQDATNDIWVFLKPMAEGDMLHANMPYVYKPKKAVTDYEFTTTAHTILKAKNTDVIAKTETMEEVFKFYGTYEPTTATTDYQFYYVNTEGLIALGNDGNLTVGAFRWIMRVESKYGDSTPQAAYARQIRFFDGEDSETTGIQEVNEVIGVNEVRDDSWYTLDGRRLQGKPSRAGVYIYKGKKTVIK